MRYKAFILLLCSLAFLGEYEVAPHVMAGFMPENCCQQTTKAHEKKPQPPKDCAGKSDCCMNCPMCSVMLLPGVGRLLVIESEERTYLAFGPAYSYCFCSSVWKPPSQA